jgi:hypothetical protein
MVNNTEDETPVVPSTDLHIPELNPAFDIIGLSSFLVSLVQLLSLCLQTTDFGYRIRIREVDCATATKNRSAELSMISAS